MDIVILFFIIVVLICCFCKPMNSSTYGSPITRTSQGSVQASGTTLGNVSLQKTFAPSDISEKLWQDSDATKEYYASQKTTKLDDIMPASWKSEKTSCGGAADEFTKFSVSKEGLEKAEALRGTIRLSENSRSANGRIVGHTSLLRNAVTPTKPIPIGDTQFTFLDSQTRQNLIAEATGKYPEDVSC